MKYLVQLAMVFFILLILSSVAISNPSVKIKFYNFDDLLIEGQYKKPQVLYIDKRQKVKFEKLLKLKKDFLPKLRQTNKDPSLR